MGSICSSTQAPGVSDLPFPIKDTKTTFFKAFTFDSPVVVLGEGGFSKVLRGHRKNATEERFAIKCLDMSMIKRDEKGLEDLEREAQLLRDSDHPNIIKCHAFLADEPNNMYWMVLEIVDGGELFDRIIQKKHYNEAEARATVSELLAGLSYLHKNDIAHRDLKPENLLLKSNDSDSGLKLADFGFAVRCNGNDRKTQCGTPNYVAPEILSKRKYGVAVDMWSCGVILFILLGGYPPFYGDNEDQMFEDICAARYEFDPQWWGPVSKEAKNLITQMMTVNPAKRITAQQALQHPWFKQDKDRLSQINLEESLSSIRKWNAKRKLRAAVHGIILTNRIRKVVASAAGANKTQELASKESASREEEASTPVTPTD